MNEKKERNKFISQFVGKNFDDMVQINNDASDGKIVLKDWEREALRELISKVWLEGIYCRVFDLMSNKSDRELITYLSVAFSPKQIARLLRIHKNESMH